MVIKLKKTNQLYFKKSYLIFSSTISDNLAYSALDFNPFAFLFLKIVSASL